MTDRPPVPALKVLDLPTEADDAREAMLEVLARFRADVEAGKVRGLFVAALHKDGFMDWSYRVVRFAQTRMLGCLDFFKAQILSDLMASSVEEE